MERSRSWWRCPSPAYEGRVWGTAGWLAAADERGAGCGGRGMGDAAPAAAGLYPDGERAVCLDACIWLIRFVL